MLLSATGTFSADSGRSIFLEQHLEQRGRKYFRWEIPYPYIYRIEAETSVEPTGSAPREEPRADSVKRAAAAAVGESANNATPFSSFLNAPRPAD
jgi:hypothetical protein